MVLQLNFKTFANQFAELDGSINGVANDLLARTGKVVRSNRKYG